MGDAKREKPEKSPVSAARPGLNFTLELRCRCKPPICPHAGPGIAKLLQAAYTKGRADGTRSAVQGIAKAAAKVGVKVQVRQGAGGSTAGAGPRSRQPGARRTQ